MHDEAQTLEAAKSGNEKAFQSLVEPYRKGLRAHCYRMTGSLHDAEEVVQESLLKAWRGVRAFAPGSSVRGWLFTVATRASLDLLDKRKVRTLPELQGPSLSVAELNASRMSALVNEPVWLEPYPDAALDTGAPDRAAERKESIGLAFLAALQTLPPKQRAVLILRDVLELSAVECAQALELSEAAVNSALQRARDTIGKKEMPVAPPANETVRALLGKYIEAWEHADVGQLIALLTRDATLSMPPYTAWYHGIDAISTTLAAMVMRPEAKGTMRLVPVSVNGQFGFAGYRFDPSVAAFVPVAIHVLELSADATRISRMTAFLDGSLFARMGLAPSLPLAEAAMGTHEHEVLRAATQGVE